LCPAKAAGDETGLGKQICWETASSYGSAFSKVNFSGRKHDLGFALMNQLATAQKRFPKSQQDIAADYFALRKSFAGGKWPFSEGRNTLNPASHCDIGWAGALATEAHAKNKCSAGAVGSALNLLQFPTLNHRCEITSNVREPECRALLQSFFAAQRENQKSDGPRPKPGNGAPD